MLTTRETFKSSEAECSINVADISMGYRVFGSGYPLLLIMGFGSTMNLWESGLIAKLASKFQVIIFDNRGIGNSGIGTKAFSIEQFCEDTSGLMDALGIQQAHVLGWSMGSLIAQELVLRHPSKVNKLILYAAHCNAEMFPPSPEILQKLTDTTGTPQERGMRYISVLFPDNWLENHGKRIGEIFFHPMGNIPEETVGQQSMAIEAWKGSAGRLGEIRSPVLLITGAEDSLVIPQNSRFMSEKIPNAQLDLIQNGGHGLMFQYPDMFCEKIVGVLE
ncbi:MAG: alpha/beta hydrolase [Deltaproteobacteria bacterium CG1_02_45_11]|nr:MAG: alpha/beta hydrolase [Deltaproteobacteria bacterium CG1_02_45_11]